MYKKLITIPRLISPAPPKKDTMEWQIPQQVSAALTLIDNFGYTLMAKVKTEKKHWWNRSWKTFVAHAPTPAEALKKGLEFLESHGYTINPDTVKLEKSADNPGNF